MSDSEWLIYQIDGTPIGPLTTSAIVEGILAGNLSPDVWIAAPGGSRWLCAKDVPVIAKGIDARPTKRQSGMRIVTAPIPAVLKKFDDTVRTVSPSEQEQEQQAPEREQEELLSSSRPFEEPLLQPRRVVNKGGESDPAPTIRSTGPRGPDGFPIPIDERSEESWVRAPKAKAIPPPSSSSQPSHPTPSTPKIYRGGETLESPGQERRKKTQGA